MLNTSVTTLTLAPEDHTIVLSALRSKHTELHRYCIGDPNSDHLSRSVALRTMDRIESLIASLPAPRPYG